jgi:hypothetical protein
VKLAATSRPCACTNAGWLLLISKMPLQKPVLHSTGGRVLGCGRTKQNTTCPSDLHR